MIAARLPMRTLELDFLNPSRTRTRIGLLVLLAGLAATTAVGFRAQTLAEQVQTLNQRVGDSRKLARRDAPSVADTRDPKVVAQEVLRANAVLANLAVPWDALFAELESAASGNVALLAIQPAAGGRKVQLSGEARRFEDLLGYIAKLEATAGFANVFLTEHELRGGGSERGVSFTVTADWVGRE